MADEKPGILSRLFGRRTAEAEPASQPEPPLASPAPASDAEGQPDLTTAAAAGELPGFAPRATATSSDAVERLPSELAGADLQPVQGREPDGGVARDAIPPAEPEPPRSWWRRLTEGLKRTSGALGDGVTSLFTQRKLDAATLEDLEDVLVQADLGVETAARITKALGAGRFDKEIAPAEVKAVLAAEIERTLGPVAKPLVIDARQKPYVVLMVGVNGAGKTTTIGKLAQKLRAEGRSVMLAAGDTFRAAAIDQLRVWGERTGAAVVTRPQGSDAAGLAYDALTEARERGADVLLVDTAGRLQNKAGLMAELEKIVRVLQKLDPTAPHAVLLVLDATVGQNALSQVELFRQAAGVTGLVMTKLDGTARGGILVALAAKFGLPVHFIGVGEGVEDLEPFAARDFARAIVGLEEG